MMHFLGICLLCLWSIGNVMGIERKYYIAIKSVTWNYVPSGKNIMSGKSISEDKQARTYLLSGPGRIGGTYWKDLYFQCTNDSCTEEIPKPEWLGFMGPVIRAEIGDTITIHLHNFGSRNYSIHPHGVQYTKANEGAYYPDNTTGTQKDDDMVMPGTSHIYKWYVVPDQGPLEKDDDCVIRLYHSHVDSTKDIMTGLVGSLLICKKGVLANKEKRKQKEFVLLFNVIDENLSWHLNKNIREFCTDPDSVRKDDPGFAGSNKMHAVNGYMYANLPGLYMCDNTEVVWYLASIGSQQDTHAAYFHGNTLTSQHYRVDTLNLFSATMIQGTMLAMNPGKWLLTCQVNEHLQGGMQAIYEVGECTKEKSGSVLNARHYYIAAVEGIWNYAPTSVNPFTGKRLDDPESESAKYFAQRANRIGGSYMKVRYIGYTDATFTLKKERCKEEKYLGILGPMIVAQPGDTIFITFKNNASRPYSIQAHGVSISKAMEGDMYKTGIDSGESGQTSQASHVEPGAIFTYKWKIPNSVGPTSKDQNCLPWLYYSSVDPVTDPYSGLVGPLLVCKRLSKNKQKAVDYNYFLMAAVIDENKSSFLMNNIKLFTSDPKTVNTSDANFKESNMMRSINGYMYGNQPGLDMCEGDVVHWHMLGLGTFVDLHGIHFTGNTIQVRDTTRDVATLLPYSSYSAVMIPDNAGIFNVECMTADHYIGGMRQNYTVKPSNKPKSPFKYSRIVNYYIVAEPVEWDYSPNRTWEYAMFANHDKMPGDAFLNKTQTSLGSKYMKVVYRKYTDITFTVRKQRTGSQEHLEILGPLLMAQVGDRMEITFKNMASRPYSIYAHGVKPEDNDIKPTAPGHVRKYVWNVPERSGPNRNEVDCLTWVYYSNVNPVKDMYTGLIGPLVICRRKYSAYGLPRRKIKHFVLLFSVLDENRSWLLKKNIEKYSRNPKEVDINDKEFVKSNLMYSINGRVYANLPGLTMHVEDYVYFHLIGMGNQIDVHTAHFHGHSLEYTRGERYQTDVIELFPATTQTTVFTAKNPGSWLLHCHVDDHMMAGMITLYTVLEKDEGSNKHDSNT